MPDALAEHLSIIAVLNFLFVSAALLVLGKVVTAKPLAEMPGGLQNAAEAALDWFVAQGRKIHPDGPTEVAPFLATLFFAILLSNLLAVLPVPILQIPPTSHYSTTLALAVVAVAGVLVIAAKLEGARAGLKHLFWPNPLQLVSELSHTLSLSLRLYGNIGGEFIVASLVAHVAPYGIPLVVHALGLIPAAVQPLVFTLLTSNFLGTALHARRRPAAPAAGSGPVVAGSPHENASSR